MNKRSFIIFQLLLLFSAFLIEASGQIDTLKRPAKVDSNLLVVINGKIAGTIRELKKDVDGLVPVDMIERVNVMKGESATLKYGEPGKYGVIEIFLKGAEIVEPVKNDTTDENRIFKKVEIEASFPGGDAYWRKYLERNLNPEVPLKNYSPPGKYTVYAQFIVDREGNISDVKALTNYGFGMEDEVLRVITKGPKWNPAIQDGRAVKAYRKQPVTFMVMADDFELSTYTLIAGKENLVTLTTGGKPEDLDITMPGAIVSREGDWNYKITPNTPGRVLLTVWIKKKGKKEELGKVSMLVKE